MKIVNNRKMLISLMTVFGFSVFVESNCCMAAGRVLQALKAEQAQRAQQARQAEQARLAEQARQAQLEEENRRVQINQNTRNISNIDFRLQTVENDLQNQINQNINAVEARLRTTENELQELREQITRQNHHITCLEYGAGLLLGGAALFGAVCYLKSSSRK